MASGGQCPFTPTWSHRVSHTSHPRDLALHMGVPCAAWGPSGAALQSQVGAQGVLRPLWCLGPGPCRSRTELSWRLQFLKGTSGDKDAALWVCWTLGLPLFWLQGPVGSVVCPGGCPRAWPHGRVRELPESTPLSLCEQLRPVLPYKMGVTTFPGGALSLSVPFRCDRAFLHPCVSYVFV